MQWLERDDHFDEPCYFCVNHNRGINWHNRNSVDHILVESVLPPVLEEKKRAQARQERSEEVEQRELAQGEEPIMVQGGEHTGEQGANIDLMDYDDDFGAGPSTESVASSVDVPLAISSDEESEPLEPSPPSAVDSSATFQLERQDLQKMGEPVLLSQIDFDNLVKEIKLSDKDKEILGSRLAMHNLMASDFRITASRKRRQTREFDELFETDPQTKISYCTNIKLLFLRLNYPHKPIEWRLFIDGSCKSLKAVLLHITNKKPSVPIAYARNVKETYASMQAILALIQYKEYKWLICADLKVVGILMGLKSGYAKHQCFLCVWEGRKNNFHYDRTHHWAPRRSYRIGRDSLIEKPLVDAAKIILPPLHIKMGVVRNFTRALHRDGLGYQILLDVMKDLGVSAAKVANGTTIKK